ncbi:MAG: hypothetical protein UY77_C0004G0003 [Candidatus Uhrbacteria bacterium GW2011_GWA2_53_10]|uniref:Uncharacterized protein n=1 Tax=Candidatus Uhrbacteria bacterium GW2011_GWA2_53_10 TaxID=1618980 RepID=A0A0G1ZXP6_9BACT|nr:MAG: hypothetical protein UY77_C0004G0003 [Candidatus Uhrbacteria bacterium GW2011_GWA2_53_10]
MPHNHHPWMFLRDEIDVLEEEFDALFDHKNHAHDPVAHEAEERILEEQVVTEEQSEAELAVRLGPRKEFSSAPMEIPSLAIEPALPLKEALRQSAARDPFYERVFEWAGRLGVWARARYETGNEKQSDFFRIQVNAYLVPVKLASAFGHEAQEDSSAALIAAKEADLAQVYVRRIRESLEKLQAASIIATEENDLLREAEHVEKELKEMRGRWSSRAPWSGRNSAL